MLNNQTKPLIVLAFLLVLVSGCATSNDIYYWGEYEEVIYKSYKNPGEMPVERQIEIFEADLQKAKSKNKSMPPGWHAHLGLLYYDLGKLGEARREFVTESTNFPESKVLVNFFNKTQKKVKKK